MAYPNSFVKFAQSVHLAVKNRYYDDILSADGLNYLNMTADWLNQFVDELKTTTDQAGNVVTWKFARSNRYTLGPVSTGDDTLDVSSENIDTIVSVPDRYALLLVGGEIASKWRVVDMDQIKNSGVSQEDRLSLVGDTIYFSREMRGQENGGTLVADVVLNLPYIDEPANEFSILDMVKPRQLLVLGVAKNSSLPDLVRGGLSPSFLQRYQDLLQSAIQKNSYTSTSDEMGRDNMSYIRGIY